MKWYIIMHKNNFNDTSLSIMLLYSFMLSSWVYLDTRGDPGTVWYSRLAHAGNVVVRGDACACTCTTPNLHQPEPGLYCINGVLSNLPSFVAWVVATTQTSSKINIKSRCFAWKEWTQNSNYSPNSFFFAKFSLCGWCWDSCREVLYMNYRAIMIKANLTLPAI